MNIVPLAEPDEATIKALRQLLEAAESGEIRGFLYVAIRRLGLVETGWVSIDDSYALMGYMAHAQHQLSGQLSSLANPVADLD